MTHIYEKGQLVIPKYFRDLLGWVANTEVKFEVKGNKLIVQRKTSVVDEIEQMAKEWKLDMPDDVDEFYNKVVEKETRQKYKKMGFDF
ncbi:MAG: AbrB/MazE/SpoVT family DNA-binding domain-containing protein [Candidatus Micrarchaeota archaeon]